jgi:pimeloyl-ACP methyl ester carboxylesterase
MSALVASPVQSVELPNRVRLEYVEQGDPTGVPVVCLHGYTDSWRSFEEVLPLLPASIRAVALSQRGHGDSSRPATGYRPHDYAADLAAFMDAIGVESAVLVGHSMGTSVAQRFAIDQPARTRGLVLLASTTTWKHSEVLVDLWGSVVSTLSDPVDPSFVREFQASPAMAPSFVDMVVQESLKLPARVWRAALQDLLATDFSPELGAIVAPTLVVWGGQDIVAPECEQEPLAAAIPNARLTVYPDAGHGVHWDESARVAADIAAFVAEIGR